MPDDYRPSYWEKRRLFDYIVPPVVAVWGVYTAITMEFNFGDVHLEGPMAILAGIGLVALAAVLLALNHFREWLIRRGRLD